MKSQNGSGLELREVALFTARREPEQPRHEMDDLVVRDVEIVEQREKRGPEIVQRFRAPRDPYGVELAGAREQDSRRLHEIVGAVPAAVAERDPPHRVGDVLVETGEEAEAVLSGQVLPSPRAGAGDRHAPGLAAEGGLPLVHGNREAALRQFVGGAEPADSATQDRDTVPHDAAILASGDELSKSATPDPGLVVSRACVLAWGHLR